MDFGIAILCAIFVVYILPFLILGLILFIIYKIFNAANDAQKKKFQAIRQADKDFLKSAENVKHRLTLKNINITDDFFGKYCAVFFNDADERLCIFERNKFEATDFIPYKSIFKAEYSEFINSDDIKEVGIKLYLSEPDKTITFPVNLITKINIREYEESVKSAYELLEKINQKLMYETIYNKENH